MNDTDTTEGDWDAFVNLQIFGIPLWQILFTACTITTMFLVLLCCCTSFRIPRTKQEIEADYIRKQIARKFRKQLNVIPDSEMDEMSLPKAIEKIRFELMSDEEKADELLKQQLQISHKMAEEITIPLESETVENTVPEENVLSAGTSEEKLVDRGNPGLSGKLVTLVNAFTVLRSRRLTSDGSAKQMAV